MLLCNSGIGLDASFTSKLGKKQTRAWLKPLLLGAGLGIAIAFGGMSVLSRVPHRLTTIAIALAFFIASLTLVPLIPKGFVDDGDFGFSNVSVEIAPGSTLEDVNKVVT